MFLRTLVFLAMAAGTYCQSATFQWIRQIGGSEGQAYTTSPPFPTTPGVFQTAVASAPLLPGTMGNYGDGDGFVVRLDSQFNILTSTLIGRRRR